MDPFFFVPEYVGEQLEDMTQTFRSKAQQFAEKLVEEVFATKEGSAPPEPAGEPPTLRPGEEQVEPREPQAYRDESRVSEYGELLTRPSLYHQTKHIKMSIHEGPLVQFLLSLQLS